MKRLNRRKIRRLIESILNEAKRQTSAKEYLKTRSPEELQFISKMNHIADQITQQDVDTFSEGTSRNLLFPPQFRHYVDQNNDDLVEVGKELCLFFPLPMHPSKQTPPFYEPNDKEYENPFSPHLSDWKKWVDTLIQIDQDLLKSESIPLRKKSLEQSLALMNQFRSQL